MDDVLKGLHDSAAHASDLLFAPLTLRRLEELLTEATKALGLTSLGLTPHTARHGGPSHDAYFELLDLKAIAMRGRWKTLSSVRRYSKKGKLQRQVNKIPKDMAKRAAALLHAKRNEHPGYGKLLVSAVRSIRRLRAAGA